MKCKNPEELTKKIFKMMEGNRGICILILDGGEKGIYEKTCIREVTPTAFYDNYFPTIFREMCRIERTIRIYLGKSAGELI